MAAARTQKRKISSAETSNSRNHNSNGGGKHQKTNNRNRSGGGSGNGGSDNGGGDNGNGNRNSKESTYKGTIEGEKYYPKHVYATFSKEQRSKHKELREPGKRSIKAASSGMESGAGDSRGQHAHTK